MTSTTGIQQDSTELSQNKNDSDSANEASYRLVDVPAFIKSPFWRTIYKVAGPFLEYLIAIKRLNQGYDRVTGRARNEFEFIELVRQDIGVSYDLPESGTLQKYREIAGPIVVVSNHPFGGIESFVIVQLLSMIRDEYLLLANFLLFRIRELQRVLYPINPYDSGSAKRANVSPMKKLISFLKSGGVLHVFPAGEVSSFKFGENRILDREWNANLCRIIQTTGATVIPLYFQGRNSLFFQMIGQFSPYIRSIFLIREFVYPSEKVIRYKIGNPISPETIKSFADSKQLATFLKKETYALGRIVVNN